MPLIKTIDSVKANQDPLDYSIWPHDCRTLIDDLWAMALSRLADMPSYDAKVGREAKLLGRAFEPWRAMRAVAAWLDDQGVTGLRNRIEELAVNYQEERKDLESGNLTVLITKALVKCLGGDSVTLVTSCDISDVSRAGIASEDISVMTDFLTDGTRKAFDTQSIPDEGLKLKTKAIVEALLVSSPKKRNLISTPRKLRAAELDEPLGRCVLSLVESLALEIVVG